MRGRLEPGPLLRAALRARRPEATGVLAGVGAPACDGSGAPAGGRGLLAFAGVSFAALTATVVLLVGSATPAAASGESCPNEARREEQGAAARALPDCRAYELVSQPYQPAVKFTPFQSGEGHPFIGGTGIPQPYYLPVALNGSGLPSYLIARDGHAALYAGQESNSESWDRESLTNFSHRTGSGWVGENIFPIQSRHSGYACAGSESGTASPNLEQIVVRMGGGEGLGGYENCGFDEPRLAAGEQEEAPNLLMRDTATGSWQLVSGAAPAGQQTRPEPAGVSDDGSHVVFQSQSELAPGAPNSWSATSPGAQTAGQMRIDGYCAEEWGNVYVWSGGSVRLLTIPPDGIPVRGALGGSHASFCGSRSPSNTSSFTNSISADGESILFNAGGGFKYGPSFMPEGIQPYIDGGLYLRQNAGRAQSALANGGAAGTGTLTQGSNQVSSLRVTEALGFGKVSTGSDEVAEPQLTTGEFEVGQTIEGEGIPPGTTITAVGTHVRTLPSGAKESYYALTLSNEATEGSPHGGTRVKLTVTSEGPSPFAAGQKITGRGIPAGTTITAASPGELTLSAAATSSAAGVALESSSQCTEPQQACTVQVDAPEAGAAGSAGEGQFQWANAATTKIFFTDEEQLTADSTAAPGQPDLYEYDVEKPEGQRLTDLTVDGAEPADVLGVGGAAEDGSSVYFVARGALTGSQQNSHGAVALGPAQGEGSLVGPAVATGTLSSGSPTVTGISGGPFRVGEPIGLANWWEGGIPDGTTIAACSPDCAAPNQLTLSNNATESGERSLEGQGSSEVTGLTTGTGEFAEGMTISGEGIPAHTWITEVGSGTLTLSTRATTSGTEALSAVAANLYRSHGGATTFVASLNAEGGDACDWTPWCLSSRVSPNGRYLAFDSLDPLTGYDNHPVHPESCKWLTGVSESPCMETFRYAAESGAEGELTCATCNPSGPPRAEFAWNVIRQPERQGLSFGRNAINIDHPLSNSGQLFFETEERLAPGDENGEGHESVDVYEYAGGEGGAAQYHLISTGTSEFPSEFVDASSTGSDVFFNTVQSLLRSDTRSDFDLYDARVDGGFPEPRPLSCEEQGPEACRESTPPPPTLATPTSPHTEGPEEGPNHLRCQKGFVLRHGKCVRRNRKHHKHHKHHHRRAGK